MNGLLNLGAQLPKECVLICLLILWSTNFISFRQRFPAISVNKTYDIWKIRTQYWDLCKLTLLEVLNCTLSTSMWLYLAYIKWLHNMFELLYILFEGQKPPFQTIASLRYIKFSSPIRPGEHKQRWLNKHVFLSLKILCVLWTSLSGWIWIFWKKPIIK